MTTAQLTELQQLAGAALGLPAEVQMALRPETDLRSHNLSSITAIELIIALEERYGITVPEEELLIENVCTLARLEALVNRYVSD
ncbi:acyl carrier protein [Paenibacillus mucilaginosus]|uniref:Carrier domain-containing protein n=2 Tax=Paenibacillus mucilaginosus TaxID=61624 RepID=I0BMG9_9BACL|nr:acyl carrier protein [Paenibacillus mucilaginosus]AEI43599.1 hypothetical protein KNP414_05075 [Paenibacillus mucilaginosus KNP414]AFH63566.2 hypothetical protein B2K_23205 [Paenibacillus mucilaginosus K02]MCG7216751.1 acyl carrier protein [Paenibacillus mucilaginosus]WDM25133.1 acyl carrier protein [Paenibacillus mucilaginosus]